MVTQSQLLNLAKQGNPQAIATLINSVLEPKGVTTIAQLTDGCLSIMVQSEKPLNQSAIVSFVRSGIGALGATSIRSVKVSAQKVGEAPLWAEEFQLGHSASCEPVPTSDLASSQALKSSSYQATTNASAWAQRIIQQVSSSVLAIQFFPKASSTQPKLAPPAIALSMPMPSILQHLLSQINPSNQWMVLGGMAAIAFASGGIVAAVTNAAMPKAPIVPAPPKASFPTAMVPAIAHPQPTNPQHTSDSLTDLTIAVQQNEVKDYLTKMGTAQEAFYQTNGRFASSLSALEQASIPKSAYYAYKLTVIDQTQAKLTAIPKTEKLKSYVSAVLANSASANAAEMTTILCESAQPATLAPATLEVIDGAIACEAGSTNVGK